MKTYNILITEDSGKQHIFSYKTEGKAKAEFKKFLEKWFGDGISHQGLMTWVNEGYCSDNWRTWEIIPSSN